jgi:hypothetical protein
MHSLDTQIPLYLDAYFSHLWPLAPIVDRPTILERVTHREHLVDQQFAALLLASASLSSMVPDSQHPGTEESADRLMREALRMHNTASLGEGVSLDSVATSMLIGAYSRAKGWNDASYLRTKETLSLAEMLNLHQEKGYAGLTVADRECAKTLYQIVRCAER